MNWKVENLPQQLIKQWKKILANLHGATPISKDDANFRGWGREGESYSIKYGYIFMGETRDHLLRATI
jgi:hypothetical protein